MHSRQLVSDGMIPSSASSSLPGKEWSPPPPYLPSWHRGPRKAGANTHESMGTAEIQRHTLEIFQVPQGVGQRRTAAVPDGIRSKKKCNGPNYTWLFLQICRFQRIVQMKWMMGNLIIWIFTEISSEKFDNFCNSVRRRGSVHKFHLVIDPQKRLCQQRGASDPRLGISTRHVAKRRMSAPTSIISSGIFAITK